jgi:uncharacterized protein
MIFDPLYFLFLAPGLLLMVWAQWRIKRVYTAYSQVGDRAGLTGAQAARVILNTTGLTDNYDPGDGVPAVAAVGIEAHESGHALQDVTGYAPSAPDRRSFPRSASSPTSGWC